jgi:hypothetical protein
LPLKLPLPKLPNCTSPLMLSPSTLPLKASVIAPIGPVMSTFHSRLSPSTLPPLNSCGPAMLTPGAREVGPVGLELDRRARAHGRFIVIVHFPSAAK